MKSGTTSPTVTGENCLIIRLLFHNSEADSPEAYLFVSRCLPWHHGPNKKNSPNCINEPRINPAYGPYGPHNHFFRITPPRIKPRISPRRGVYALLYARIRLCGAYAGLLGGGLMRILLFLVLFCARSIRVGLIFRLTKICLMQAYLNTIKNGAHGECGLSLHQGSISGTLHAKWEPFHMKNWHISEEKLVVCVMVIRLSS